MKRVIVLIGFMFFAFASAQGQMKPLQDVVYLMDGGVIKGVIIEQIMGESLKIRTADGSVFVYPMDEVLKFEKEENPNYSPYPVGYREKNPALAWMCSFFIPGLGQMVINEQYWKGAGMLVGFGLGSAISSVGIYDLYQYEKYDVIDDNISLNAANAMAIGGFIVAAGLWIWSMVDAPLQTKKINKKNLTTWEIGESILKLNPDFTLNNYQVYNQSRVQPTVGMKLSLEF